MQGNQHIVGIDLGGTNTKFGVVSEDGELLSSATVPTPARAGRGAILELLKEVACAGLDQARELGVAPACVGVATPGWVDAAAGRVLYAGTNLPGWSGVDIASELGAAAGLPVAVENDANALAVAERRYGLARETDDFVCVTLGTGIGSGCYVRGRLLRGAHSLSNELGHIPIDVDGLPCSCGKRGCLEAYASASALVRYAEEGAFASAREVIAAAGSGDPIARGAVRTYARFLALGCVSVIHLLDPSLVVFAGGLTQNNPALLSDLEEAVVERVLEPGARGLRIEFSRLGYFGGVLGAAAAAAERLEQTASI